MPWFNVALVNTRKHLTEMQRYLPNTISMLITFYVIFLAMFFGISTIGDPGSADASIRFVIVSNAFWFLAITAMSSMGWEVTNEAMRGTLEQLYMSPMGAAGILLIRMVANTLTQLVVIGAMLVLVMWTAGQWLTFDLVLVPILIPTLISMIGIGYVIAGLSVVFKQIQALLQIVQFVFLGMAFVPLSVAPWLELTPFVKGVDLTRQVMTEGLVVTQITQTDWLSLLLNAAVYFALGLLVFNGCERRAMARGLLGHY